MLLARATLILSVSGFLLTHGCSVRIPQGRSPTSRTPVPPIRIPGTSTTPPDRGPFPNPSGQEPGGPTLSINSEVGRKKTIPEQAGEVLSKSELQARGLSSDARFQSWSLFLIPNYDDPYRNPALVGQLKKAFQNLGNSIGSDHLSAWLIKGERDESAHPETAYDYDRAQQIISSLGLDSATGPYIVITLKSPNKLASGDQVFVVRLKGIHYQCYPQIVDDLAIYIREKHYALPELYNSVEQVRIDMARYACSPAAELWKLIKK